MKVIWSHNPGPTQLVAKSPMHTLDELKGLRIGCVTPREAASLKLLGATPVALPMPDHYTALERGVIDGTSNDFNADFIWKTYEVTKYRTDNADITQRDCPIIMNIKTYNSLPADLKTIFDQVTDGLALSKKVNAAHEEFKAFTITQIVEYDKKAGNPAIYVLPADEKQKWLDKVLPVRDQWVNEMQAKSCQQRQCWTTCLNLPRSTSNNSTSNNEGGPCVRSPKHMAPQSNHESVTHQFTIKADGLILLFSPVYGRKINY